MKKGALLTLFTLILLTYVTCVSASYVLYESFYNYTDLPAKGSVDFNFSLQPNATIYFQLIQNSSLSTLKYPASITLNSSQTIAEFEINYSLPILSTFNGNLTFVEDIINISNSVNQNSVLLKMQYTIYHKEIFNETEQYMRVSDNGRKIIIRTFSALAFNQTHHVVVEAPEGEKVNTECGRFITCPTNITVPASGKIEFDANIYVPKGQAPALYNSSIIITSNNNTAKIDVEIIIEAGDDIYNLIVYDVFDPDCFTSPTKLAECYKQQARYNAEIAKQLLGRIETCNSSFGEDNYIVNETIKYVEVGNIDPDLFEEYGQLRADYNQLSGDYKTVMTDWKSCVDKNANLENSVTAEKSKLANEFLLKRSETEKELKAQAEEESSRVYDIVLWWLGAMVLVLIVVLIGGLYMENKWMIQKFPAKWIFTFFVVVVILWIIVKFIAR